MKFLSKISNHHFHIIISCALTKALNRGRYRYLSTLKFVKTIGVALITGLVWWQIGRGKITEQQALDIGGALFFITVFNSFNSLFDVLVICKLFLLYINLFCGLATVFQLMGFCAKKFMHR